LTSLYHTWSNL